MDAEREPMEEPPQDVAAWEQYILSKLPILAKGVNGTVSSLANAYRTQAPAHLTPPVGVMRRVGLGHLGVMLIGAGYYGELDAHGPKVAKGWMDYTLALVGLRVAGDTERSLSIVSLESGEYPDGGHLAGFSTSDTVPEWLR